MRRGDLSDRLALIVVTDPDCGPGRSLLEVVRAALSGGARAVQLRAKRESTREALQLARALREETDRAGALLFINDRIDVALAAEADGAHLGDDDLPVETARRIVPTAFILGASAATPDEAVAAHSAGADYLGVGPVYLTGSKPDAGDPIGEAGVRAVSRAAPVPVVGIGGITPGNAGDVAAAGAVGVAVIRGILAAPDPEAAAREILRAVRARVSAS